MEEIQLRLSREELAALILEVMAEHGRSLENEEEIPSVNVLTNDTSTLLMLELDAHGRPSRYIQAPLSALAPAVGRTIRLSDLNLGYVEENAQRPGGITYVVRSSADGTPIYFRSHGDAVLVDDGYGDSVTLSEHLSALSRRIGQGVDLSQYALRSELPVVPTFKTINGESIIGTGNITIGGDGGGGGSVDLSAYSTTEEMMVYVDSKTNAAMDYVVRYMGDFSNAEYIAQHYVSVDGLKTINGESLLGSGNITIGGGGGGGSVDLSGYSTTSEMQEYVRQRIAAIEFPTQQVDNSVTQYGANPVKSSGVWTAIRQALSEKFQVVTRSQYDAMATHDENTFYFIRRSS